MLYGDPGVKFLSGLAIKKIGILLPQALQCWL